MNSAGRSILEARARKLAQPAREELRDAVELVYFTANGAQYALEARFVTKVTTLADVCPLPSAPPEFAGVTNLAGAVLPVVHLAKVLGVAQSSSRTPHVVVLGRGGAEFGLPCEAAEEFVRAPLPPAHAGAKYVRSLLDGGRMLLDAELLLDDPRLTLAATEEMQS